MPLPNIERTTLLNPDKVSFMPGDEELVHPIHQPLPPPHLGTSSSSQPSSFQDYTDIHATPSPFKRSMFPYELMSNLSIPPSMTLFKSGMMSSMG